MEKGNLKDRLNEALILREKKAVDLTKDLGIPKSAISQYLSGKSQKMDADRLQKIASYLNVSEAWLAGFDVPQSSEMIQIDADSNATSSSREAFVANLRLHMAKKQKSRKEVSEAIGVSYFTFSDWCNGKKYPRIEKLEALADYFGISVPDLIKVQEASGSNSIESKKKIEAEHIEEFGNRLQFALNRTGMSQSQLASATGITKATISRYISGVFEPKQKAIQKLATTLNVSEKWLSGYDTDQEAVDEADPNAFWVTKKAKEDVLDIILRLHSDTEFLEIVEKISTLDNEKLKALQQFLKVFGE
jgi:transcriptional regulator with XRE-family HTH domain